MNRRLVTTIAAISVVALGVSTAAFFKLGTKETGAVTAQAAASTFPLQSLALQTATGQPANLKDWQGRVVVLNYWATWCPPCREEMPDLSRSYDKFKAKSVKFAGIAIDSTDNVNGYLKTNPVTYPIFIANSDLLRETSGYGNASLSLPFTLILDTSGKVAFARQGRLDPAALDAALQRLMQN